MSKLNILLGGVPFGCNNIGDEAILSQVVSIVRGIMPDAQITVSTGDPKGTTDLLEVNTCPLYSAFSGEITTDKAFYEAMDNADVFIWSGATGLSDYPHAALDCISEAQRRSLKTVVFCTGMNNTFNPAHFKLNDGVRKTLYQACQKATLNRFNLIASYESQKISAVRARLKAVLDKCDLVINRDIQSKTQLMKSKLSRAPVVAADPAISLPITTPSKSLWGSEMMDLLDKPSLKIGICISSQQEIKQLEQFSGWVDKVVAFYGADIVFIPMNPITDFELMSRIRDGMYHKESSQIASGSSLPEAVAGLASKMDVIISSRLHLLIFAAVSNTPSIGIGRGSKVSNFLSEFGFCTAGDTDSIEFEYLDKELNKLLSAPETFAETCDVVRRAMVKRLENGIELLGNLLLSTDTRILHCS